MNHQLSALTARLFGILNFVTREWTCASCAGGNSLWAAGIDKTSIRKPAKGSRNSNRRVNIEGQNNLLIYFGQTIIEKAFRGKSLIPVTGAKLCFKFLRELLFSKVYFWADALTYKAYLVFAKTLNEYYPSRQAKPPVIVHKLVDFIGEKHYPESYCPKSGTVKKSKRLVADPTVNIHQSDLKDADVKFYLEANPNCKKGHGLITIAPVNRKNISLLLQRYLKRLLTGASSEQKTIRETAFS